MSGSVMVIIVAAIMIIAVIAISRKKSGEGRVRDLNIEAVGKKREKEPAKESPEIIAAKKELYQYLNRVIKKMFQYYRRGNWDDLTKVAVPSEELKKHYQTIKMSLPSHGVQILDAYASCIDWKGSEDNAPGQVLDSERLKEVFHMIVLPFYPVYFKRLDGIRYTSLLNQTTLNLFHRLTGRKFRLGYKNRYQTGVAAYQWEKERYKVYAEDGVLLCDAVFKDGKVWEGYAVLPVNECGEEDWDVMQEGIFKEGLFVDGILHYIYKKTVI